MMKAETLLSRLEDVREAILAAKNPDGTLNCDGEAIYRLLNVAIESIHEPFIPNA